MNNKLNSYAPYALALLRIIAAYMFIWHGTAKFFEYPVSMTGGNGGVALFSQYGLAGVLEIGGGILLALGLFTRPVAFLLSGQMAVAYFMVHGAAGNILMPLLNQGELAALYSVVFLYFVFAGPGALALDNKICKK
ncbi:DoxX family protein [Pasteurellaceae bacterium USgator11]|nr:DoxX family protein [Pasteurellaceae bacterium USgator41]TNG93832.1 DoxX family protein [Pasteurellaceae bacterium UScroc12]TNG98501.1 DoxX family protein [Pasteurellaceae bacterium UScroc31]TNH01919.1 DoxX family protein [Pasteurellaceae bacterium USgator11]